MELQVLSGPEVALLSAEEKKKYETYLVEAQRALNLSPKELEKDEADLKEAQALENTLREEQIKTYKAEREAAAAAAAVPIPMTQQAWQEAKAADQIAADKLNAQRAKTNELKESLKTKTSYTYQDEQGKTKKITPESTDYLVNRHNTYVAELRAKLPPEVVGEGIAKTSASAEVAVEDTAEEIARIPFLDNSFISGVRHDGLEIKEWNEKVGLQTNPKTRIFIMGIEFSDYVTSITWSNDCGAEQLSNNASVTLQVPHNLLTLTEENLDTSVMTIDNLSDRKVMGNWRLPAVDDFRTSEQLKLKMYEYKRSQNYYEKITLLSRWNLTYNTVVLHSGDTCRIFAQIPWVQQDAWYPIFTGYVDNLSIVRNVTGEDVITFSVVTIATKLGKSRVSNTRLSPSVLDLASQSSSTRLPTETVTTENTGTDFVDSSFIYTDLISPSLTGSPLYNMTLPRLLRFLFFGDATIDESELKKIQAQGQAPDQLQEAKTLASQIQSQQQLVQGLRTKLKSLPISNEAERKAMESKLSSAETQLNSLLLKGRSVYAERDKPLVVSQNGQLVLNIPSNLSSKEAKDKSLQGVNWADLKYKRGWGYLQQDLFVEETFPGPYLPEPISVPITAEKVEETTQAELAKAAAFDAEIKKAKEKLEKEVVAAKAALDAATAELEQHKQNKKNDPKNPGVVKKTAELEKKVADAQKKYDAAFAKQTEATNKVIQAKTAPSNSPKSKDSIPKSVPVPVPNPIYSSRYGQRETPTAKGQKEMHNGVDIATGVTDLMAPCDGYVIQWEYNELAGQIMRFLGVDGVVHDFYHLTKDSISALAKNALDNRLLVKQKSVLAKTGNSGKKTTGHHLHWGVWVPIQAITKDTATARIPGLTISSNRDYSAYKGPEDWLTSQGTLTAQASSENATKVEDIPLPYDESNIDWELEEQYFANWHVRCLVGFANGVPPEELNPVPSDLSLQPSQLAKQSDETKRKNLEALELQRSKLEDQALSIQKILDNCQKQFAENQTSPLTAEEIKAQSNQLQTIRAQQQKLEFSIQILITSLGKESKAPAKQKTSNSVSSATAGNIDTAEIDAIECRRWAEYRYNILKGTPASGSTALYPKSANEEINPNPRAWLTEEEVSFIGRNSGWLGVYSPHGRAVTVALKRPLAGWGYSPALQGFTLADVSWDVSYQSRLELLSDMLKKLDYYWMVTGNGDVVVDFPHYELLTSHYGKDWGSALRFSGLTSSNTLQENFSSLKSAYVFRGGFFGGSGNVVQNQFEANKLDWVSMTVLYKLPNVLAREGIDIEYNHWPYINDKARLHILAGIHLRKQIANCYQYSVSQLPAILYLIPNTPVYFKDIDAYTLVRGTNFNWTLAGNTLSYNMGVTLTAVRLRLSPEQIYLRDQYATDDLSLTAREAEFKAEAGRTYIDAYNTALAGGLSPEEAATIASNSAFKVDEMKQKEKDAQYLIWLQTQNVKTDSKWLKGISNGQ